MITGASSSDRGSFVFDTIFDNDDIVKGGKWVEGVGGDVVEIGLIHDGGFTGERCNEVGERGRNGEGACQGHAGEERHRGDDHIIHELQFHDGQGHECGGLELIEGLGTTKFMVSTEGGCVYLQPEGEISGRDDHLQL